MTQPLNATMTEADRRPATTAAGHRLAAARAAHPSQGRPRSLAAAATPAAEGGGPGEATTGGAGTASRPSRDTGRPVLRLVDEDGSLVTEYGLLAVVAATVAGVLIQWASGGALVSLFNALLSHARELVGA